MQGVSPRNYYAGGRTDLAGTLTPCCVIFRSQQDSRAPLDVIAPRVLVRPNRTSLDPYVSHLRLSGQRGDILLVDLASKTVLARRAVG
jgi:hypothetical protein